MKIAKEDYWIVGIAVAIPLFLTFRLLIEGLKTLAGVGRGSPIEGLGVIAGCVLGFAMYYFCIFHLLRWIRNKLKNKALAKDNDH